MTPEEAAVIAAAELSPAERKALEHWLTVSPWSLAYTTETNLRPVLRRLLDADAALRASRGQTPENTYTALEAEGWTRDTRDWNWALSKGDVELFCSDLDDEGMWLGIYLSDSEHSVFVRECTDWAHAVATARALARIVEGAP